MRVLIQLKPANDVVEAVLAAAARTDQRLTAADVVSALPGVALDPGFAPVPVPRPVPSPTGDPLSLDQATAFSFSPADVSVVVRGEIADDELGSRIAALTTSRPDVTGVFSDPAIGACLTCGGDEAVGTWSDVATELQVSALHSAGLTGEDVALVIADSGINQAHLETQLGRRVSLDAPRSWTPAGVSTLPGGHPVDHGTMCAFDALIAAPEATLLDVAVLLSQRPGSTVMEGFLSDAVAAYAYLYTVLSALPDERRALVISNSWGSFSPQWDFPPGHPGNYSDNKAHPFNVIVSSLEAAGADVVFAAGNCGRDCPDGRCEYPGQPMGGANSHPRVLSIGGVDLTGNRVGYSSQGPGRLARRKPDLCAYTHFAGSDAFPGEPDSGTSAACPVAAGVVAAVRTTVSAAQLTPAQLRTILRRTADDRSASGFDYDYGYGVIDVPGILGALDRRKKLH